MKFRKEYLILIGSLIYIIYCMATNFNKIYDFRGVTTEDYALLTKKPEVKPVSKEEKCRKIFEDIFKQKFIKIKPDFLINPQTKHRLEYDGFNSDILTKMGKGLAFEYNGPQHYHFTPMYHKSEKDLEYQKYRDTVKQQISDEKGILLITIPYTVEDSKLKEYIHKKLCFHGLYYYL